MDLLLLKTLHIGGAFALFASLGAVMLGSSANKLAKILHGVSLLFILVVGFAMLGKTGAGQYFWMVKFGLWLFIGLAPLLTKKEASATCRGFLPVPHGSYRCRISRSL